MNDLINKIKAKKYKVILSSIGVLIAPAIAFAVVQSLNGQTGQTQSFGNDANITITSGSDVHTLGWIGTLPIARGGTGVDSLTSGSVLFMGNGKVSESNQNFFWDNANKKLGIENWKMGENDGNFRFDIATNSMIIGSDAVVSLRNNTGDSLYFMLGNDEQNASASFGIANDDSYAFLISAGDLGTNNMLRLQFGSGASFSSNIEVSGHGKFEADTNSTIHVGSSVKSGCIAMGDSDGSGITYITANDGVLTASTSKPNICQ